MSGRRVSLITNARLFDPASGLDEPGSILFEAHRDTRDGVILALGAEVKAPKDAEVVDAQGALVCPGLIDLRAVIGEPGAEHRETYKSAGRAAAAGGVTTLVQMPNTDPVIDDVSLVDFVVRRASSRTDVRILPAAAMTRGLNGEMMTEMGLLTEAGAVFFSNGDRSVSDSRVMRRALAYASAFGALVAHRPEDPTLSPGGAMHEGELSARLGISAIAAAAEVIMLERDLALAELTGARLLVDLVSAAGSMDSLRRAKARGVKVSASVSVHHLALNENDVAGYRTFAKLSPPLRGEQDRRALIEGLSEGLIDVIVSGHDPRPAEDKRLPFDEASFGASALETLLPGALQVVHAGEASLRTVLGAMTANPAALLGLAQGRLAAGAPADVILVDLGFPLKFNADAMVSKSKNSPFDGRLMQGRCLRTYVGGRLAFAADGSL
jgi:dihydroorotase